MEVTTPLDWEDLILDAAAMRQVQTIVSWVRHERALMGDWGLGRWLKPGYRALFVGPPGTGKTLAALLIGKALGLPVYRIDVTGALGPQLDEAEKRGCVVLVEIDTLVAGGDRAANQQTAHLLQRLEAYPGLVIVASNVRSRMEETLAGRFELVIHFLIPRVEERLQVWRRYFVNEHFHMAKDVDLAALAKAHELSAGAILNVLRYAALMAAEREVAVIQAADLREGIRRELAKLTFT